jgi:hypothetical protein
VTTAIPSVLDAKRARRRSSAIGMWVFGAALVVGVAYAASHLISDLS